MNYEVQENCLTIFLPKELDHHNAEDIRKMADRLIEKNHIKYVIFDFKNTNFMDSSGIGLVMGRFKLMQTIKGEIQIVNTPLYISKVMKISGIEKLAKISNKGENYETVK